MRCICGTVEDFLHNLTIDGETAFQNAVRVMITRNPVGSGKDVCRYEVHITASALVRCPDGSEYILEFGKKCGIDHTDGVPENQGTQEAEQIAEKIRQFADQCGLRVLPGMLDY